MSQRSRRWLVAAGAVFAAVLIAGFVLLSYNWPYRYRKIKPLLEDTFGSQVVVAHYHRTYFPHPGFVATGISLRRKSAPDQPPIGSVDTLFVQGRWIDLLTLRERVQLVDMTGVHVAIPPAGSRAIQEDFPPGSSSDFTGPDTLIEHIALHQSTLDILKNDGGRLSFPILNLRFDHVQRGRSVVYRLDMQLPLPSAHLSAQGSFGPLNAKDLGATPATGRFELRDVRLHDVGNIRGTLTSDGQFKGSLAALQAEANSHTPDFAVDDGTPVNVSGDVHCVVNALNGSVLLQSIQARIGNTVLYAGGAVEGSPKTTKLDVVVKGGRVQDLMQPFLHGAVPITGSVSLHTHVYVAPAAQGDFFHRLQVDGAFDIPSQRITNQSTEHALSSFSERAQGNQQKEPAKDISTLHADAVSSLVGKAAIRDGIVTASQLTFTVVGAQARLSGSFNLHTSAVHMEGSLATHSDLSRDAGGFKSMLLKPLDPFFKKHKAGAVIPIAVVGTSGHYQVTQNITHSK